MSAGLTHELNQPLTALRAYLDNAQVLLQRGRADAALSNLGKMQDLTERMGQLTRQLKTFARRGEPEHIAPVSIREKLHNAIDLLSHNRNPAFQLSWDDSTEPTDIKVLVEPIHLEQVLVNILQNALDAMCDQAQRNIVLRLQIYPDDTLGLCIRDNGPGIPETLIDTLDGRCQPGL